MIHRLSFITIFTVALLFISCGSGPESQVSEESDEEHQVLELQETDLQVAVADFEVLTAEEDYAMIGKEIAQEIHSAFIKGGVIQPVERQEFENLIEEIKLSMSYSEEDAMLEAGKILGADFLLFGSFNKIGEQCKISFRLVDTETSEIIFSESARGMISDIFDLEEEVAQIIEENIQ